MKKILLGLIGFMLVVPLVAQGSADPKLRLADDPVEGEWIALFEPGSPAADYAPGLADRHGATYARTWESINGALFTDMSQAMAEALSQSSRIRLVEQNAYVQLETVQANPSWGLDRTDQRDLPLSKSFTYDYDGTGMHVYVIDSGVRTSHSEFSGRVSNGYDFVDGDDSPEDCHGHGTRVAGTAVGTTYGVAKKATLHSVRVLNCGGRGTHAWVVDGIDWVTNNHVSPAVGNMSFGGSFSEAINQAVNASVAAGVFQTAAAGNYKVDACGFSPQSAKGAVVVGATDPWDRIASFSKVYGEGRYGSNYGPCVDLFAPGYAIATASSASDSAVAARVQGTSIASPHVAGVAALLRQEFPGHDPEQIREALLTRATPDKVAPIGPGSPNLLLYNPPSPTDHDSSCRWSSLGDGNGMSSSVDVLAVLDMGDSEGPQLYAGGSFITAGGVSANGVARWNGTAWSRLGPGVLHDEMHRYKVQALTVFNNRLYAGGDLREERAGSVTTNVMQWDGTNWSAVGGDFEDKSELASPVVETLAVFRGSLWVGGHFTTVDGKQVRNLARWDGLTWSPVSTAFNSDHVSAMTVFNDELYVAGQFVGADGEGVRILKWNGADWSILPMDMVQDIANGDPVWALAALEDDTGQTALYAGGNFTLTTAEGPAENVAKWNGAKWSPLGTGVSSDQTFHNGVTTLAALDDGNGRALYAGGDFERAGDKSARYLARWDFKARVWSPLSGETNARVDALASFDGEGGPALWAGGSFTKAGETTSSHIGRYSCQSTDDGCKFKKLSRDMGGKSFSVAVGDFNQDGTQDLAVMLWDSVSILLGQGMGVFGQEHNFALGSTPSSLAVGDFNGDGIEDLAILVQPSSSVSILLGDSAGSFALTNGIELGGLAPSSVASKDLNGDGRHDLAVSNEHSQNISILLSASGGSDLFEPPRTFSSTPGGAAYPPNPLSVAFGNFNKDRWQDLAVALNGNDGVAILLGNGLGSLGSATTISADFSDLVAVDDIDGDGWDDIVHVQEARHEISISLNSAGSFGSPAQSLKVTGWPNSIVVGDLDNDGKKDIAVADYAAHVISIFWGQDSGLFGEAQSFDTDTGSFSTHVDVGDFDNNGWSDLVVANFRHVSILMNVGCPQ